MAQPAAGSKLRIRLKGLGKAAGLKGVSSNHLVAASPSAQLRNAVEAFCKQGIDSLPGCMLLPPWHNETHEQQWAADVEPMAVDQQVLRRVRRPRSLSAAELAVAGAHMHLPQWGRHRQRRSNLALQRRSPARLGGLVRGLRPEQQAQLQSPRAAPQQQQPLPQPVASPAQPRQQAVVVQQPSAQAAVAAPAKEPQQQQQEPTSIRPEDAVSSRLRARKAASSGGQLQEQPSAQSQQQQQQSVAPAKAPARKQAGQKQKQQPAAAAEQEAAAPPAKQRRLNNGSKAASGGSGAAGTGAAASPAGKAAAVGATAAVTTKPRGSAAPKQGAAGGAAAAPEPTAGVPAALKPESPPSETSHQQPIAAPQLMQRLQAPQMPQEQTAVSRDRSQCSLQQQAPVACSPGVTAGASAGAAAAGAVPGASVDGAAAAAPADGGFAGVSAAAAVAARAAAHKGHLLELAPSAMTPAAQALSSMRAPAVTFRRVIPADRPIRTQEAAVELVESLVAAARAKKHLGDRRMKSQGCWDVMALNYYALSALEFLMLNDAGAKLLRQLQERRAPVSRLADKLAGMNRGGSMFKQVGGLCNAALQYSSNCKGPDVAKQALRMLLERMAAICQLKHVHSQREALSAQARLLKSAAAAGGSRAAAPQGAAVAAQQQQQQRGGSVGRPPAAARPVAAAAGGSSSGSPAGQHAFNKRSPDDSNTSNQERLQLSGLAGSQQHDHVSPGRPQGGSPYAGGGGGSGVAAAQHAASAAVAAERALMLAESQCAEQLGDLLKITDGMHQTVMRMQQYLEAPEVVASDDARAAALHISVLGLDAGMYSVPRIVAHAEAALTSILKYMRSAS